MVKFNYGKWGDSDCIVAHVQSVVACVLRPMTKAQVASLISAPKERMNVTDVPMTIGEFSTYLTNASTGGNIMCMDMCAYEHVCMCVLYRRGGNYTINRFFINYCHDS